MNNRIKGKVIRGKQRGRELDFPTANIAFEKKIKSGIYAGLVRIDGRKYKAGIFVGPGGKLLEAHLIGFSGDLYGEEIEVEIGKKLRDVIKFSDNEGLKRQVRKDINEIVRGF